MAFMARRFYVDDSPLDGIPVKAYLNNIGFQEIFEGNQERANSYFMKTLAAQKNLFSSFDYVIASIWGNVEKNSGMIDVFGFKDSKPWETSNPKSVFFEIRNHISYSGQVALEDTQIVLGREGEFRRSTKNLYEFVKNFPELPENVWTPFQMQTLR